MRTVHSSFTSSRTSWPKPTTLAVPGHQRPRAITRFKPGDQNGESRAATGMSPKLDIFADSASDASNSLQAADQQDGFLWTRNWWPMAPLDILDKDRPTAHTILGQDLVAWWSKEDKSWQVFKDMCPHRLAPLSQGRIVDGSLMCSYHGWRFGPTGACEGIPQIKPAEQHKVCNNKRTCAATYPTMEENDCLYVWLDTSEQGLAESRSRGVAKHLCCDQWSMLEVPNDFRSWMEQAMDPSHANFLHAGDFFAPEDAIPMTASALPLVHPTQGFKYSHGGYEKKNAEMVATRAFIPPSNII